MDNASIDYVQALSYDSRVIYFDEFQDWARVAIASNEYMCNLFGVKLINTDTGQAILRENGQEYSKQPDDFDEYLEELGSSLDGLDDSYDDPYADEDPFAGEDDDPDETFLTHYINYEITVPDDCLDDLAKFRGKNYRQVAEELFYLISDSYTELLEQAKKHTLDSSEYISAYDEIEAAVGNIVAKRLHMKVFKVINFRPDSKPTS